MAAFSNPAQPRMAGSKAMTEHPHQLGLAFGQTVRPMGGNLLLQSGKEAGLPIVRGGNGISAKPLLLQKVGKSKSNRV